MRSFGFNFRDSLLSGTATHNSIYLFYKDKEYPDIQSFIKDIQPTNEESEYLTKTTHNLINKP
jgi:hypothetical protein